MTEWRFMLGYLFFITFFLVIAMLGGPQLISGETGISAPTCDLASGWTAPIDLAKCVYRIFAYIFRLSSVSSTAKVISIVLSVLTVVFVYILAKLMIEFIKAVGSILPFT